MFSPGGRKGAIGGALIAKWLTKQYLQGYYNAYHLRDSNILSDQVSRLVREHKISHLDEGCRSYLEAGELIIAGNSRPEGFNKTPGVISFMFEETYIFNKPEGVTSGRDANA
jgi:hypothetical protein